MNSEIVASLWAEKMWRETHNWVSGAYRQAKIPKTLYVVRTTFLPTKKINVHIQHFVSLIL